MSTTLKPWQRTLLWQLATAALYFGAARLGLRYAVVSDAVTLVWPPSGLALALLLLRGPQLAPGVALGAWLVNLYIGLPWPVACAIALGNTGEAWLGSTVLQRLAGFHNTMARRSDVLALIVLAAMGCTLLAATVGSLALWWGGVVDTAYLGTAMAQWWLGDMMGVLVVAPLLLVALTRQWPKLGLRDCAELVLLSLSLLALLHGLFGTPEWSGRGYFPAALAVFPFAIWGALRFGHWGACWVTLLASALAIAGTTQGTGPFAADTVNDSLVRWCLFVNILAVTGLLLAASSTEQKRIQHALMQTLEELERRIAARTQALSHSNTELRQAMATRRSLETALLHNSEEQQQALGRELHDGLGQDLTSMSLLSAALEQQLQTRQPDLAPAAARLVGMCNQAIATTRAVSHGLYPAALATQGLPAALQHLLDMAQASERIACHFSHNAPDTVFDKHTAVHLYRATQELVNNALKHSACQQLQVHLRVDGDTCTLIVQDDGHGLPQAALEHQGLGLRNVRYRMHLLGGTFRAAHLSPHGTVVTLSCPLPGPSATSAATAPDDVFLPA